MRDEHFVDLRGKRFVLYSGLLAMAHEKGLEGISEDVVQIPTEENGHTAIVKATARYKGTMTFDGIGDASPKNVGKNIAPHVLRMASTRAKARALRDMCNIGEAALEELGDADEGSASSTPRQPRSGDSRGSGGQPSGMSKQGAERPATTKQLNYLEALLKDQGEGAQKKLEDKVGKPLAEFTASEASEWIKRLSG